MTTRSLLAAAVLTVTLGASAAAGFATLPVAHDMEAAGWRTLTLPGTPATRFAGRADGAIEVNADRSFALLYRGVAAEDRHKRYLAWRWRVDRPIPATDLTQVGADDRPLAVHVWFSEEPGDGSLWQPLRRAVSWVFGAPEPGKVLTYVWGGDGRRGDHMVNPHLEDRGVMFILRPAATPSGMWFDERIDVRADFERAFGRSPPPIAYIAVSADTDDTKGLSMALIADIGLTSHKMTDPATANGNP